jgi:tRNA pseudouridine(38-40) synthase
MRRHGIVVRSGSVRPRSGTSKSSRFEKMAAQPLFESTDFSGVRAFYSRVVHEHYGDGSENTLCQAHDPCTSAHEAVRDSLEIRGKGKESRRRTYVLAVAYEGWKLNSFGLQPEGSLSAQNAIEKALRATLGSRPKKLSPAGRTDRGTSASCQICSFQSSAPQLNRSLLREALHVYSCGAVSLVDICDTVSAFHAQFQAQWRRYLYLLPMSSTLTADVVETIRVALRKLEGRTLDMTAFARDTPKGKATRCKAIKARAGVVSVPDAGRCLAFELVFNRLLRRLARVLVSTSVAEALEGVCYENCLVDIAKAEDRLQTAVPAPADGLIFSGVGYSSPSEHEPRVAL